jgi:Methyltransferase FkbM domain
LSSNTGTLDDERSNSAAADLIGVDVQGHEEAVLRGGRATISRDQPLIVYECFHAGSEINTTLRRLGYRIFDADRAETISSRTTNYFGLPRRLSDLAEPLLIRWKDLLRSTRRRRAVD